MKNELVLKPTYWASVSGDDMLDYRLNFCDNCGQKLDWSELE